MKPTKIPIMLAAIGGMAIMLSACAKGVDEKGVETPVNTDGVSILLKAPGTQQDAIDGLDLSLYIFAREAGSSDEYLLEDEVQVQSSGQRLEMRLEELKNTEYRFLFLGTDTAGGITEVVNVTRRDTPEASMTEGDQWSNLRLRFTYPSTEEAYLSIDNYYDVVDMSGTEIIEANKISGDLTRLVGQLAFDFFKGTSPSDPLPVDKYVDGMDHDSDTRLQFRDPDTGAFIRETDEDFAIRMDDAYGVVASVMDRIYQVDIEYTGMTELLRFDQIGGSSPVEFTPVSESASSTILKHSLTTTLHETFDDKFRYNVPRTEQPSIVDAGRATGSARIKGLCFPPSEGMNAKLTVHYYDTTLSCDPGSEGTWHDVHEESCYPKQSFSLSMPQPGGSVVLAVEPDKMTVTRAALPCSRIIDLKRSGGFIVTDHEWTND